MTLSGCRLRTLLGVRVARLSGWAIASGFGCAMLVARLGASGAAAEALAVQAVAWLAWLSAGPAALSSARDLAARDAKEGILALALQRGHSALALRSARGLATVSTIATVVGAPTAALAVLMVVLSDTLETAAMRALLGAAMLAYVLCLSVVLGAVARWASALAPRHGRTTFAALVFGPYLAQTIWQRVPSVPTWFQDLWAQLLRLAGGVG